MSRIATRPTPPAWSVEGATRTHTSFSRFEISAARASPAATSDQGIGMRDQGIGIRDQKIGIRDFTGKRVNSFWLFFTRCQLFLYFITQIWWLQGLGLGLGAT